MDDRDDPEKPMNESVHTLSFQCHACGDWGGEVIRPYTEWVVNQRLLRSIEMLTVACACGNTWTEPKIFLQK